MKKRGLLCLFAGMALMSFTIFNSCEIGLGESVDVESPVIIFDENPPTSAVIRSAFPVSGTWKDDGSISKVSVVLENLATHTKYTFDGTIKDNTWSATIDPIKSKIPDGKYEATITLSDNGGHTSSSSRSFTIDNTAPVVVLSRPSSEADESDENKIESYGQYLTLEGQAADDNNIECIIVKFYSKEDPDTLIGQKKIESIPPTISLDIAHYLDKDIYSAIYGDDKEKGDQYYFCTISAFDSAKQYFVNAKGIVEEEDLGNEESSYILWSKWEQFQLDYQKTTGSSSKIKLPELYAIKAGTNADSKARSAGENALITNFFNDTTPRASFKLNPKNNPSFSISGLDIGLENDVENDRPLTIQLAKGLDGLSLDTEKMKVYLIPLDEDENGKIVRGKKIYPQQSEYQNRGDGQFLTIIQKDNVKDENGNAVSLEYSKVYVIGVEGKDIEGNQIVPSFDGKEFFIRFKAKNVAPGLTISEPVLSTSYIKKNESLLIKGSTSVPDGYPTITITCKKGDETKARTIYTHKVTETEKAKEEDGLIYYNFEFEVPTSGNANEFFFDQTDPDQYVFDITSDLDSMPSTRTKTVLYDIAGPTISIDSMLPTAEKYDDEGNKSEGEFLNGDVEMKVAILDEFDTVNTEIKDPNNDKRPYFIIEDADGNAIPFRVGTESIASIRHYITKPAKQSFKIKTEDIASGTTSKNIKVKIFAEDRAGNLGVDIADETKSYFEREYTVDQTTDIPLILPKNAANTKLSWSKEDAQKLENTTFNVYFANQTVLYRMIDDDGLVEAKYQIKKAADESLVEGKADTIELKDVSEYQIEVIMPEIPGTYHIELETKDMNGISKAKDFYIRVTAAAPTIEEIANLSTIYNGSAKVAPKVIIKSDQVPFTLERTVKDAAGNEISAFYKKYTKTEKTDLGEESPEVEDEFNISDGISEDKGYVSGEYTVEYKVTDKNTRDVTKAKSFTVDLIPPVISEVKIADSVYDEARWNNSKTLSLRVKASDTHISPVEYSLNNLAWTALSYDDTEKVYYGTIVLNNEGSENLLYIRAKDTAGNITYFDGRTANGTQTLSSIKVKVDTSAPNLSGLYFQKGSETPVAKENSIYVKENTKLTVYGNYDDVLSGAGQLSLTLPAINEVSPAVKYSTKAIGNTVASIPAASEYKLYSEITNKAAIKSWKAEFTPKASGEFNIHGSDLVSTENKNTTAKNKVFDINYDATAPEFEISTFKGSDGKEVYQNPVNHKYYVNNTNKTFELTGTSADNIAVESVTLTITKNGTTTKLTPSRASDSTLGRWKFTGIDMQTWGGTGATAVITVTDKAGNKATTTLDIVFDITKPVSKHEFDAKTKDLYFRIGDFANDVGLPDVGGKYSEGTYSNTTSFLIRGLFEDDADGSGINQYYYKVYNNESTITAFANEEALISDVIADNSKGTFKPLSIKETKSVDCNNTDGSKTTKDIDSNYKTPISNLKEEHNYVVIVAEDNAGNRSVDTVNDKKYYSLNVDTILPKVISLAGESETQKTDVELTVTMEDSHPVAPEVVIEKDGSAVEIEDVTSTTPTPSGTAYKSIITIPFSKDDLVDGTYTVRVRAKDKAKNLSDPVTKTIIKDTIKPVIKITNPAGESSTYIKDNNYKFEGKITELNEIGTATAYLYMVGEATAKQTATLTPKRTNGSDTEWTWSWQVYGLEASDYYVEITAQDIAGNSAESEKSETIKLDNTAPKVSVTATYLKDTDYHDATTLTSKSTYYAGNSYEITVTVDDVNFDYDDEICVSENTVTSKKGTTANTDFSVSKVSAKSFKITPTYNSTDINGDGTYEFTISVKDKAGNESDPVIIKVQRDITPPEVKILSPSEPEADKINVIKGESYSFRISAKDGSGVGVANLDYAFSQNSDAPLDTEWVPDNKFTDGEKIIEMPLKEGLTLKTDEIGTKLCEGNWYLYAKSADKSGNATTTLAKRAFTVDLNNPSISVEGLVKDKTNILSDEVGDAGYELNVTVSDTNDVATSNKLVVNVDGKPISETSGKWIIEKGNTDGKLKANNSIKVELIATDIVGNKTTETYYLYNDTLKPTLEITAPVEAEAVGSPTSSAITIKGTASDDGYGVEKVEYVLYSGDVDETTQNPSIIKSDNKEVNSINFPLEKKGEQWKIAASTGMPLGDAEGAAEGQMTLAVTVTENKNDTHGGRTTTVYRPFYFDKANPNLDETGIGPAGKTTNGGTEKKFSLSGTSSDSNALESVTIKWKVDHKDKSITLTPTEAQKKSMSWSQEFVVGSTNSSADNYVADGTNEFTIIAKDISGKEKQLTRTVIVDTIAPTCGTPSITSTGTNTGTETEPKIWFNTSSINIEVPGVTDTGSGVSKVEYSLDGSNWYLMSGSGTTYTATVNCPDQGLNTIQLKITDVAGNFSNAKSLIAYIDTVPPSLENSYAKYLTDDYKAVSELLINGDNGYSIKISAKDEDGGTGTNAGNNSGIASVQYSYGSNTIAGTKTGADWYITVPTTGNGTNNYSDTGSNKIYVIIKDNAGNEIKERILTVTKDETPPTVEIKSFTRAGSQTNLGTEDEPVLVDDVNGTITISGLADDTNRFGSVKLEYTDGSKDENNETVWTLIPMTSQSSWTTTLDTTATGFADKAKYTIKATATDAAGNTATDTQDVYVKQDSDRPVISITDFDISNSDPMYLQGTKTLSGNISDDDGNVKEINYSTDKSTWKPVTKTGPSSWRITDLPEGANTLYFQVKDAENTNFESGTAKQPKITDAKGTTFVAAASDTDSTIKLSFNVVTIKPKVTNIKYQKFDSQNGTNGTWGSATNDPGKFGGNYTRFKIQMDAQSAQGISSVKVTYNNVEYTLVSTDTITTENKDQTHTYVMNGTSYIPVNLSTQNFDGQQTISIVAADTVPNSTPTEMEESIYVDNKKPVISATNPSSSQYSSGNVIAYGETDLTYWKNTSTTDQPKEFMYYALSLDDTTTPAVDFEHQSTATAISSWKDEHGTSGTMVNDENGVAKTYKPYYTPIKGGSFNWYVYFDGSASTESESHDVTFRQFLVNSGVTTEAALTATEQNAKFKTKVQAYLWIKAVDQVGNFVETKHPILIDPQGDAPSVTIDYPETDGTTLGGSVTLRGTAKDEKGTNPGVDSVWVQIISAKENGYVSTNADQTFGNADTDSAASGLKFKDTYTVADGKHSYEVTDFKPTMKDVKQWIKAKDSSNNAIYEVYTNITTTPERVSTEGTGNAWADTADGSAYYIKAKFSGSAWSLDINKNSEFNPAAGKLNPIAYRIFAKDKDKNLSSYEQQLSVFDSDNPILGALYLRQYSDNDAGTGNVVASRPYEDDMWINGTWWLYGTVTDTDGLSVLKVNNTDQDKDGGTINYKLSTTNEVDSFELEIVASDNANNGTTPHTTKKKCVINYDKKKPELAGTTSSDFNISQSIQNSNGFYTFGSQVTENQEGGKAQSGFDYLAFWFEREITGTGGKHVVFDVMRPKANSEVAWSDLATFTTASDAKGLKWKKISTTRSSTDLGKLTINSEDKNIHVGGICMISGSIYFITSVEKNTTTNKWEIGINGQPEYTTETQYVYFAIANIVNNNVESGRGAKSKADGTYGYYTTVDNDDGDHMLESVKKQGTAWTWEANINSQNMSDGDITLHYVAFDKAGNYKEGSITGQVANNAPRLASVTVWSDFNGNKEPDEGESETMYYQGKERKLSTGYAQKATALNPSDRVFVVSGNSKDFNDGGSAFMTVKDTTRFIPEIVGGNGDLYYSYKYGKSDAIASATANIGEKIGVGADHGIDEDIDNEGYYKQDQNGSGYVQGRTDLWEGTTTTTTNQKFMEIQGKLDNETTSSYSLNALGNTTATDPMWFEYTIYDSTTGCKDWTDTNRTTGRLSSTFRVALNLQYVDSVRPNTVISPLYWKSSSDNSVYHDINGTFFGHVELKSDLGTSTLGTDYGTDDDKVSGIVVFRGFAYDNKKLTALNWAIVDHDDDGYDSPSYKFGTGMQAGATFNGTTWSSTATMNANHYTFEVSTLAKDGAYHNQDGHKVAWTLTVDTSYITGIVGENLRLIVQAADTQAANAATRLSTISNNENISTVNPDTNPAGYASATYRSTYKFDVLPYITGVTTRLANKNRTNKEAYSRTALGHYAIASNETAAGSVLLHGYNLKAGNTDVDISSIIGNRETGDYAYTVSGTITTINNINNNDAHGDYDLTVSGLAEKTKASNMYNRKPLTSANITLTDDVYFDIWEFDADAAKPSSFLINDAVMKINPRNNMIGFAFANGQFNYCMPNWNTSYTNWQSSYEQYHSVGLAYDSAGYSYGVGSGGDCNAHQADLFNFMTSKFGRGTYTGKTGSTGGDNALRMESIGQMFDTSNIGVHDGPEGNNGRIDELYVDKDRIMSPSIATSRPTSGGTNIYLAYFDRINDEIRFRSGNIADPGNAGGTINKTNIGTLTDSITGNEMEPDRGGYAFGNYNDGYYSDAKAQIIAKQGSTNLLGEAGPYVSLGVVKKIVNGNATNDDVVVMVWYDQYSRKLCYAYNDSPLTARTGTNKNGWTKGTDILEEGGEYCNLVIDADNGIHIAATHEGQIKYVYLSNYLDTARNVYTVDCDASNLTIDVAKTGTRNVPYLSYYSTSQHLPKYAYLVGTAADGYNSEGLYTGAWEVTYLPVEIKTRTVPEARINVGVFKVTNTGVKTYSTTNKNAPTQNGSNIGTDNSGAGNGTCYGNGTDNPVVGYVVNNSTSSSYIEVAQLK